MTIGKGGGCDSRGRINGKEKANIYPQTQIKYLISIGRKQWEGMERYIDGL